MHVVTLAYNPVRFLEGRIQAIALAVMVNAQRDICAQLIVNQHRAIRRGVPWVHDRFQRFVVHADKVEGVPCLGPGLRHYDG